jgi:formylglycine-generating enzyme required for sulfatase activity
MRQFEKVLRGGYWFLDHRHCRSAYFYSFCPDFAVNDSGFRVCCLLVKQ